MRKILYAMMRIRQDQLADRKAPDKRISECGDMFKMLDHELSGIKPTSTNEGLREVMTSADFTYAIEEFVQRQALPGYQRMEFPFEPLIRPDTLPNYLAVNRYQMRAGVDDLEYVGEKGQARPGSVDDATKRVYQVYGWQKEYDFSHQALVNDDLGYFANMATLMGQAARRTLEKFVSRMYTNATSIARLTGLGVNYSQAGRLTSSRISEARMGFGQRTDARGEPAIADLAYIVYHRGLTDVVRTIQASPQRPEDATNAANVVRTGWVGIKDPHMAGTAPDLPWWAFVDPNAGSNIYPFVLARRAGWPGPLILRKASNIVAVTSMLGSGTPVDPILGDFASGNIVLKVWDVWGTYMDDTEGNYFDFRGGYYSSGTAP